MGCPGDSFFRDFSEPESEYERGYIAGLQDGMINGLQTNE